MEAPSQTLADLSPGATGRVRAVALSAAEVEWLRAVGVATGQRVTVLRRGLWGGPLHVRTGSGGEFAVDRALACAIEVEAVAEGAP